MSKSNSLFKTINLLSLLLFIGVLILFAIQSRKQMDGQPVDLAESKPSAIVTDELILSLDEIKAKLEKSFHGIVIDTVEVSPIKGFYQAFYDSELLYISKNGQFIMSGTMLELSEDGPVNHSQITIAKRNSKQAPVRASIINKIDDSELVVFKSEKEKFVVTVFTDVDCAYCRKLHREVPQLNKKGITVRYMAFPRAGLGSSAYDKLVSVWCSDDRPKAMDDAKLKRQFGSNVCKNPISDHYQLTRKFGLTGTPALILEDGELIAGYLPADKLYEILANKNKNTSSTSGI